MTAVRGMTLAEYGALQAIYYWAGVLLEVPTNALADRFGRKPALLLGALATAAACALFAVARGFWTFAAAEAAIAFSQALLNGSESSLLYDSLRADDREAEYPRAE
ncbi:MAG: MFS transporter, partial [Planctomycetota bacterium]